MRQAAPSAPVFQKPTERAAVRCRFLAAAGFRWLHGARGYPRIFLAPIPCEGIEPQSACFQHYGRPTEGRPAMLNVAIVGTFAASLEDAIRRNLPCLRDRRVGRGRDHLALADIDVLVTMVLTREMARACRGSDWSRCPAQASTGSIARRCPRGMAGECPRTRERNCRIRDRGDGDVDPRLRSSRCRSPKGDWQSQWAIGLRRLPSGRNSPEDHRDFGYGRIGQAVARRACAFGMKVYAVRRDARRSIEDVAFLGVRS